MWLIGAYVVFTGVHTIGLSLDPFVLSVFLAGVNCNVVFCSIAADENDVAGLFVLPINLFQVFVFGLCLRLVR